MDLSTRYLGLDLDGPLILGASPLAADLDAARRAEDAGASALVMSSLFEEQAPGAPASGFYPADRRQFDFGPVEYLEQVRKLKAALGIPVIASLNGTSNGAWLKYAAQIDQAGADALELNIYRVNTDFDRSASSLEDEALEMLRSVVALTSIPVAVKLSPYYTSLPNFAMRLVDAGAKGLILFNRFYQPDIDTRRREVAPELTYSTSLELSLRLRWLAILSAKVDASLAVTGGVHDADDALKAVLTGAHAVQLVSEILQHGFVRFSKIQNQMSEWLTQREYHSLAQVRGSLNLAHSPSPFDFERANYLHVLHSYPNAREWGLR
jgi:dihydroorotate dehydrogenase (fumarate)